eukprot:14132-Heterococcus_DN1.PRE.3
MVSLYFSYNNYYYCNRAHYLNNHIRIVIHYSQKESFEGFRVVGFEVAPFSIKHAYTLPAGKSCIAYLYAPCELLTYVYEAPSVFVHAQVVPVAHVLSCCTLHHTLTLQTD